MSSHAGCRWTLGNGSCRRSPLSGYGDKLAVGGADDLGQSSSHGNHAIELDYAPRDETVDAFHDRTQRMCCWIAHRRFGKTVAIANDGPEARVDIPIAGREHAPPRIAWMYPTRVRAKDIAWSYLKYYTRQIPGVRHIESELAVEFADGRRFTLYGADGHRGVGQYLDGIYYDERDDIPDSVIVDLAPTLADYGGLRGSRWDAARAPQAVEDARGDARTIRTSEPARAGQRVARHPGPTNLPCSRSRWAKRPTTCRWSATRTRRLRRHLRA